MAMRFHSVRASSSALLVAVVLGASLSSCLIGSSSRTENTGQYVSQTTLAQIQPGKDAAYVVALIGEPTVKSTIDGSTEIWKWCYTERKNSSGHVILLVSSDNRTETQRTTFVEFKDSKVVKAWTD